MTIVGYIVLPGRYVIDVSDLGMGTLPSDPDYPAFALALNFDVEELNSPVGIVGLACGSTTTACQNDPRVAAEIETVRGTIVAAFADHRQLLASCDHHFGRNSCKDSEPSLLVRDSQLRSQLDAAVAGCDAPSAAL